MNNKLAEHFTYSKLLTFTLPTICMMIFTSIYTIVDGFFISNYVGKTAFAAINLVWPALMIIASLGFMVGSGGSAIVGRLLGEKRQREANQVFTMMFIFTFILGIISSILGYILTPQIVKLLKASEDMFDTCVLYGRIINAFNFTFMLQYFFQSFFVTASKPRLGFIITISAGITNMILDALFIAIFKWGVAGAALATGIGQILGGFLPVVYFSKKNDSTLMFTKTKLDFSLIGDACFNGSSELMSSISSSFVGILYNFQLMKYSGENGIAAYGVLMYTQMIFQAIYLGYTVGVNPIVSYNYGSENHNELNNIITKSIKIIAITGVCMFSSCFLLSEKIAHIFVGYDQTLMEITSNAFKLYAFSFLFSGFNIYASGFFTSLGNGKVSAIISFLRSMLFQLIAVYMLPMIFGLNGIWWAVTAAEICAIIVSTLFIVKLNSSYHYF